MRRILPRARPPREVTTSLKGIDESEFGDGVPELVERLGNVYVRAYNQGGHDSTEVDVRALIKWLRDNRPDLLKEPMQ